MLHCIAWQQTARFVLHYPARIDGRPFDDKDVEHVWQALCIQATQGHKKEGRVGDHHASMDLVKYDEVPPVLVHGGTMCTSRLSSKKED